MTLNLIYYFIKYFGVNIGSFYAFNKIINKNKYQKKSTIISVCIIIVFSFIQLIISSKLPHIFKFIFPAIFLTLLYSYMSNEKVRISTSASFVSMALSYIASIISIIIFTYPIGICKNNEILRFIFITLMSITNVLLLKIFFSFRRFKHGFPFLKNEYLNLSTIFIAIAVILAYAQGGTYSTQYLVLLFILIILLTLFTIKYTFILYQKQKLQNQALKDYEAELAETSQKLQTALEEKEKLIKTNHEFYHRQEALKNKLNQLITSSTSTEAANEYSNILDRINNLSQEYSAKLAVAPKLQSTNIEEIDDMLSYFQSECIKNNIEFIFKLDCNIDKIITEHIDKSNLETLIGDLLRNAIIAINNSSNMYRSIMLLFGLKDSCYQIDIYDSGIEFKIETLLKLGLEKASTYIGNGGTGIGMLTTFETLNKTKSSLTITEFEKNSSSYTKLISIKSDKQNNYCINSPRADIIKKSNIDNRNIIIK